MGSTLFSGGAARATGANRLAIKLGGNLWVHGLEDDESRLDRGSTSGKGTLPSGISADFALPENALFPE